MATVTSDFVDVQLSAAGIEAAGTDGAIRVTAAHLSYAFKPGARVRVLTSEWAKVLSRETLKGNLILELAPPAAPAAIPSVSAAKSTAKSAQDQLKAVQAEEAALQTQIAEEGK